MKALNIGEACVLIAFRAAVAYCDKHQLRYDREALIACCKSWCKAKLPEALHDAKEAMACHMDAQAEQTFAYSMAIAGIEAAKEAGNPYKP